MNSNQRKTRSGTRKSERYNQPKSAVNQARNQGLDQPSIKPFKVPANPSTALPTPPLSGGSVEPSEHAQDEGRKTSGNEEDEVEEKLEEGDDAEEDEDEERSPPARHSLPPEDASSDDDAIIVHKRPFRRHTNVEHTAASSSHSSTPTDNHESTLILSVSASRPSSHAHSRSRTHPRSRPSKHVRFLRVEVPTWKAIQQERVREARLRRQAARSRSLRSSRSISASVDRGFSERRVAPASDDFTLAPAPAYPQGRPTEPVLPDPEDEHDREQRSNAEEDVQQSDPDSHANSYGEQDSETGREEERHSVTLSRPTTQDADLDNNHAFHPGDEPANSVLRSGRTRRTLQTYPESSSDDEHDQDVEDEDELAVSPDASPPPLSFLRPGRTRRILQESAESSSDEDQDQDAEDEDGIAHHDRVDGATTSVPPGDEPLLSFLRSGRTFSVQQTQADNSSADDQRQDTEDEDEITPPPEDEARLSYLRSGRPRSERLTCPDSSSDDDDGQDEDEITPSTTPTPPTRNSPSPDPNPAPALRSRTHVSSTSASLPPRPHLRRFSTSRLTAYLRDAHQNANANRVTRGAGDTARNDDDCDWVRLDTDEEDVFRGATVEGDEVVEGDVEVEDGRIALEGHVGIEVVEEGEVIESSRDGFGEDPVQEEQEDGEIILEEGEIEDCNDGLGTVAEDEVVEQQEYAYAYDDREMSNKGQSPNPGFVDGEGEGGNVDASRDVEDGELVDEEEDIVPPVLGAGAEARGVMRQNPGDASVSASGLEEGEVVGSSRDEEQVQVADDEVDMELDSDGEGCGYGRIETFHGSPHEAGIYVPAAHTSTSFIMPSSASTSTRAPTIPTGPAGELTTSKRKRKRGKHKRKQRHLPVVDISTSASTITFSPQRPLATFTSTSTSTSFAHPTHPNPNRVAQPTTPPTNKLTFLHPSLPNKPTFEPTTFYDPQSSIAPLRPRPVPYELSDEVPVGGVVEAIGATATITTTTPTTATAITNTSPSAHRAYPSKSDPFVQWDTTATTSSATRTKTGTQTVIPPPPPFSSTPILIPDPPSTNSQPSTSDSSQQPHPLLPVDVPSSSEAVKDREVPSRDTFPGSRFPRVRGQSVPLLSAVNTAPPPPPTKQLPQRQEQKRLVHSPFPYLPPIPSPAFPYDLVPQKAGRVVRPACVRPDPAPNDKQSQRQRQRQLEVRGEVFDGICGRVEVPLRREERPVQDERETFRLRTDMRFLGRYLERSCLPLFLPEEEEEEEEELRREGPVLVEQKKTMTGEYVDMMRGLFGEVGFERAMGRKPVQKDVAVKVEEGEASIPTVLVSHSISPSSEDEDEDEDEYYYHDDNDEDEPYSDHPNPLFPAAPTSTSTSYATTPIPPFKRKVNRKPSTISAVVNAALATQRHASSSTSTVHVREERRQKRAPCLPRNALPRPRTPTPFLPDDFDPGVVAGPAGVVQSGPDVELSSILPQTNANPENIGKREFEASIPWIEPSIVHVLIPTSKKRKSGDISCQAVDRAVPATTTNPTESAAERLLQLPASLDSKIKVHNERVRVREAEAEDKEGREAKRRRVGSEATGAMQGSGEVDVAVDADMLGEELEQERTASSRLPLKPRFVAFSTPIPPRISPPAPIPTRATIQSITASKTPLLPPIPTGTPVPTHSKDSVPSIVSRVSTQSTSAISSVTTTISRRKKEPKPKPFSLKSLEGDNSAFGSSVGLQKGKGERPRKVPALEATQATSKGRNTVAQAVRSSTASKDATARPPSDVGAPSGSTSTSVIGPGSLPAPSTTALPVVQEEIEEWVGFLQRLVKGKVAISEEGMLDANIVLTQIESLKDGLGVDVLQSTDLGTVIRVLSTSTNNIPFGDPYALCERARVLVLAWGLA